MPKVKQSSAGLRTERPHLPGYGISKSKTGLLPTVRSDGRPHAMIIWGLWFEGAFWFGTGSQTQKAHNLAKNPNCVVGMGSAEATALSPFTVFAHDALSVS
jgi:general stress protein 26